MAVSLLFKNTFARNRTAYLIKKWRKRYYDLKKKIEKGGL